ncbi:MAG: hypothetical protein E6J72_21430, partial [Deltaproteobacteria bacterium]
MTAAARSMAMPLARCALIVVTVLGLVAPARALTLDQPPTSNAAVTTRGDGNGYEVTPANAYGPGVAQDINSGASNQSATCVDVRSDAHYWSGFDFSAIPSGSTINNVIVKQTIAIDSTNGMPTTCGRATWDDASDPGSDWTAYNQSAQLTTSLVTYNQPLTGHAWTLAELQSGLFKVETVNTTHNNGSRDFTLDTLIVTVDYTPPGQIDFTAAFKCNETINKEYAKYVKTLTNLLEQCNDARVKSGAGDTAPGGDIAACDPGGKLPAAFSKLESHIVARCDNAGLTPAAIGWPSTCPNFESGSCTNAVTNGNSIADCLDCVARAAIDQAMDLYYLDLSAPGGDSALIKCQSAIGKETSKFLVAKQKALGKCRKNIDRGTATAPCPVPGDAKAGPAIQKAESKKVAKICGACGGGSVDGVTCVSQTYDPSQIGFAGTCPDVTVPNGGPGCAAPVNTLNDLVKCVDCVTEFKVDCADALSRPDQSAYPSECGGGGGGGPTPTPTGGGGPTATRTLTPTPTTTPSGPAQTQTPTPIATLTPIPGGSCGDGTWNVGEECDPAGGATTSCQAVANTSAAFTCSGTCTCACPSFVEFTGNSGTIGVLDSGWTGQGHDATVVNDGTVTVGVTSCAGGSSRPCGVCTLLGPVLNLDADAGEIHNQRCSGNTRTKCTTNADCSGAGGTCEYYFGSNLPLVAGAVATCVSNQINGMISGTADVESGTAATTANLISRVYTGPNPNPCPKCIGDGPANDGIRAGTCDTGPNMGLTCDVNGTSPNLFWGSTSLDCPPIPGAQVASLPINLSNSTGTRTVTLTSASPNCRAPGFTTNKCFCDTCDNLAATPCMTNADCVAVGATVCGGRRCIGGTNNGTACSLTCAGGANVGLPCTTAAQCPGSSCTSNSQCPGGACNVPGAATAFNQCTDTVCSPTNTCLGGANQNGNCSVASECPGGSCIAGNEGTCSGGPFDQFCGPNATFQGCASDPDCAAQNN